jgi:hypothetical protein
MSAQPMKQPAKAGPGWKSKVTFNLTPGASRVGWFEVLLGQCLLHWLVELDRVKGVMFLGRPFTAVHRTESIDQIRRCSCVQVGAGSLADSDPRKVPDIFFSSTAMPLLKASSTKRTFRRGSCYPLTLAHPSRSFM